jgi:radical S-adenosyl methionine domain-containing protein 2
MYVTTPLVINWHLTEVCNYRCQYCYAKWNNESQPRELIHNSESTLRMLTELYRFFQPDNKANPLTDTMSWNSIRLNLAGGEPLLYPQKFISIVKQASNLGFDVSLISNASQLDRELLELLAPHLTWLGISLDSQDLETNKAIGRIDNRGHQLDLEKLATDIQIVRQRFSGMRLKINTVVNLLNHQEDLSRIITNFSPDKWKVLQMLPVLDQSLSISSAQFTAFINRHRAHDNILNAESNQDMSESYLMIDPNGRFFQNSQNSLANGYCYSQKIIDVGIESAFSEMTFDSNRFNSRYIANTKGEK